jgi:hypothetical protein
MLRTRRRNKITRPEEDRTLKQWGGLNAETRGGIEPDGEEFSLDIPFYRDSTAHSVSAPSDFLFFGGCKLTRAKRTSKRATRAACVPCRGT